jgi:hypothetical protein
MRRSTLELAVGGRPFPHGDADGGWRYRHAVRPEGHTPLDAKAVADFLVYEAAHGRSVTVVAEPSLADWESWTQPTERPAPGQFATQCCTHAFADGCGSQLVCHGAPPSAAIRIVEAGILMSASEVTGRPAAELAAGSTWGEPPDYFDYVMFANGRCTAPEAVALSRTVRRDLVPSDLRRGYTPAVRFYFDWTELAARSDAAFDGVHPVKIKQSLELAHALAAVVVHEAEMDAAAAARASMFADRLIVLDLDRPTPDEWASAADEAAKTKKSGVEVDGP